MVPSSNLVERRQENNSMAITNRGSPCHKPFLPLKKPHSSPLIFMEKESVKMHCLIQFMN